MLGIGVLKIFYQKYFSSKYSSLWLPPLGFEGKYTGVTPLCCRVDLPELMGVDLQIETNPKLRPPACHCANLVTFLHVSRQT